MLGYLIKNKIKKINKKQRLELDRYIRLFPRESGALEDLQIKAKKRRDKKLSAVKQPLP